MKFEGTVEINAPRDRVWEFVSDPAQVAACGPGVESVAMVDETHYKTVAKIGVGFISARFNGDVEIVERQAQACFDQLGPAGEHEGVDRIGIQQGRLRTGGDDEAGRRGVCRANREEKPKGERRNTAVHALVSSGAWRRRQCTSRR